MRPSSTHVQITAELQSWAEQGLSHPSPSHLSWSAPIKIHNKRKKRLGQRVKGRKMMWMLSLCLSLPDTQDLVQGGKEERRGPRRCSLGREVELWADPVGRRSSQGTGCLRLGLPHHQQPQTHSCLGPQKRTCSISTEAAARPQVSCSVDLGQSRRLRWPLWGMETTHRFDKNGSVTVSAPAPTLGPEEPVGGILKPACPPTKW